RAPTTEMSTLALHDALPILRHIGRNDFHLQALSAGCRRYPCRYLAYAEPGGQHPVLVEENAAVELLRRLRNIALHQNDAGDQGRSEEHTSELQSRENLVCRL